MAHILGPACAGLLALVLLAAPAAALSGVCPDGSIFVVRTADAIPCPGAKRVDPNDVPPIQPDLLPRPYGWERFNRRSDPNNPYNVVETPAEPGASAVSAPPDVEPNEPPTLQAPTPPAPTRLAAAPRRLDLTLSEREIADLDEIVALMQDVAPATVTRAGPDGERQGRVQLAHSLAFEERLHGALGARPGPVVLFRAESLAAGAGLASVNLTFVQGHIAFHPDPERPEQFGVLDGELGAPAGRVLGYAVLPLHLDPARPLDVYWDDRRITATLRP